MENDDFSFLGGPSEERLVTTLAKMEKEPWNRCINETSYDTDDLTKIFLIGQEIITGLGESWRSDPLLPCQVWFRNFTPGEASHKEARETVPNAKASLVKTSRISAAHCPSFGFDGSWIARFFTPSENGRSYGILAPIVKPTAKFFEDIGTIETLLLCDKIAPPQLAEQIIWKLMRVDWGRYSMTGDTKSTFDMVQLAARRCPIKFKLRGVDSEKDNKLRLAMARLKYEETQVQGRMRSAKARVKRAHMHLGSATEDLDNLMEEMIKHQHATIEVLGSCARKS